MTFLYPKDKWIPKINISEIYIKLSMKLMDSFYVSRIFSLSLLHHILCKIFVNVFSSTPSVPLYWFLVLCIRKLLVSIVSHTDSYIWWVSKGMDGSSGRSWFNGGHWSWWQKCWENGTTCEWTSVCLEKWFFCCCISFWNGSNNLWHQLSTGKDRLTMYWVEIIKSFLACHLEIFLL